MFPGNILAYYTNMPASVVVGQPDFVSNSSATSTFRFNTPAGIFSDGTRLFISDQSNNRVLIWNNIPTSNSVPADIVLGQPDFSSSTANNGGISANTLNGPVGLFVAEGRLIVSDSSNHRVLIWNTIPTQIQQPADVVVGQVNLSTLDSTGNQNQGLGVRQANTLFSPIISFP